MQVKMKPAKVFEVIGLTGRLESLRQIGSEWNDMVELQDADGRKLILCRASGIPFHKLTELLGDGTSDWTVVAGSPDLLHTLGHPPKNESPASQAEPSIREQIAVEELMQLGYTFDGDVLSPPACGVPLQAEPLSKERIEAYMDEKHYQKNHPGRWGFNAGVRWAEKSHGIKGAA